VITRVWGQGYVVTFLVEFAVGENKNRRPPYRVATLATRRRKRRRRRIYSYSMIL